MSIVIAIAEAFLFPRLIQPVQVEICKQGRNDPTLRRAGRFRPDTPISSITPALSHIAISFTTDRSMTLDRTDSSSLSCGIVSKYDLRSASTTQWHLKSTLAR
jgi:hypothetical protein